MLKRRNHTAGILLVAMLAGCKPAFVLEDESPPGPVGFDAAGAGSAPMHDVRIMSELAMKIVQETPAGTLEGVTTTTARQIEDQTGALEGSVMFPRWTARRVGANDYEVRFTFTHIDNQYNMEKKGLSWIVNVAQKAAGPRRILHQEDFGEEDRSGRTPCEWEPMMFREGEENEEKTPE